MNKKIKECKCVYPNAVMYHVGYCKYRDTPPQEEWEKELSILLLDIFLKQKPKNRYPLGQLEKRLTDYIFQLIKKEREKFIETIQKEYSCIGPNDEIHRCSYGHCGRCGECDVLSSLWSKYLEEQNG